MQREREVTGEERDYNGETSMNCAEGEGSDWGGGGLQWGNKYELCRYLITSTITVINIGM